MPKSRARILFNCKYEVEREKNRNERGGRGERRRVKDEAEDGHHPWIQPVSPGPLHPGFPGVGALRSLKTPHHLHILADKGSMLIGYTALLFYRVNGSLTSNAN